MSTPMSTTEVLEAILDPRHFNPAFYIDGNALEIEAEAAWFSKSDGDPSEGEAQAVVRIAERRYAISLERLP